MFFFNFGATKEVSEYLMGMGCDAFYRDGIIRYIKKSNLTLNTQSASHVYHTMNQKDVSSIIEFIQKEAPKTIEDLEEIKEEILESGYTKIDVGVAVAIFLNKNPLPDKTLKAVISESNNPPENMIAIKKLIAELEDVYMPLLNLDTEFMDELIEDRPLIVLMMLTRKKLRKFLLENYDEEIEEYIEDEDVYKQLVPYIKIYDGGKTHGKWRHLADSKKKTCIVLYIKDCSVASSKNTNKSYERESFLVLEGLSVKAEKESAELHYLEV